MAGDPSGKFAPRGRDLHLSRCMKGKAGLHAAVTASEARGSPCSPARMSVRVVRLGTPRIPGEGIRIGTVRRPPRGVPRAEFASQNWYDVWFPNLAPSAKTVKLGLQAESAKVWAACARKYRTEMSAPDVRRTLELLAVLSHTADFSIGCYCENEDRCHRSILRELLLEHGALVG